jgi:hypothetical protein
MIFMMQKRNEKIALKLKQEFVSSAFNFSMEKKVFWISSNVRAIFLNTRATTSKQAVMI